MGPVAEVNGSTSLPFNLVEENGLMTVILSQAATAGSALLLHNAAGTLVHREELPSGETVHQMGVRQLPAGMYVARLVPDGHSVKLFLSPE